MSREHSELLEVNAHLKRSVYSLYVSIVWLTALYLLVEAQALTYLDFLGQYLYLLMCSMLLSLS